MITHRAPTVSFSVSFLVGALAVTALYGADDAPPPNIIFVLADDLGWSELGCYGNRFNETPNLDILAREGMRFTQAYASAPVCSPFRASFLTGQVPARHGITDYLRPNSANALSTAHVTLPEMLKTRGYTTGMIGKWHLSGYHNHDAEYEVTPRDHGFDWDIAREKKGVANGVNFWPYQDRVQNIRWLDLPDNRLGEDEFLVDRMNLEAVEFIERHKDRPFFLYLSHYAPHTIVHGKPQLVDKYTRKRMPGPSGRRRCAICSRMGLEGCPHHHWATTHNPHLAAMLESIDDGIGLIRQTLERLGLADNTVLIFTSDNGGETNITSNAPLRGGKSQLHEGGLRIPMVVRWPNQVPAGTVCEQPTMNTDYYPTLLEAAGISPDESQLLDGISTLDTWRRPDAAIGRETLYWHYPLDRPHFLGGVSSGAIRHGDWKLIESFETAGLQLYHLGEDPAESTNLAAEHADRARDLRARLALWRESLQARTPSPPLLGATGQLTFSDHFSSNRASTRWWFNDQWSAESGVLVRGTGGTAETRVFARELTYGDSVIRFDFQLRQSQDIRLVTGADGHYNTVIHIRPDHFFIQTAKDESGPYFSYHHGECAYRFSPDRWYTMTVEFVDDHAVAHLDRGHLAYAHHPLIKKERDYFALQVDQHSAAFDNIQILTARRHPNQEDNLRHIQDTSGLHPVTRPTAEAYEIQKRNAHEWFYQRDESYRELVQNVADLDARRKKLFPRAFQTHKEFHTAIIEQRKMLLESDPQYKEMLFATYRADRATEKWLLDQKPGTADLPDSRRRRELGQLRARYSEHPGYVALVQARSEAQIRLEKAYPQLFVRDAVFVQQRDQRSDALREDPQYQQLNDQRAAAYNAQQQHLHTHDTRLAALKKKLDSEKE